MCYVTNPILCSARTTGDHTPAATRDEPSAADLYFADEDGWDALREGDRVDEAERERLEQDVG